jgi:L-histidine Nalpha-methyltransferase
MTPANTAGEGNKKPDLNSEMIKDIVSGLSASPKYIPSKYFYDKTGDDLFCQITQLPEYYLSDSETEIFSTHKHELFKAINSNTAFNLIELGSGDGQKTKFLIEQFYSAGSDFVYTPIDISKNALLLLKDQMNQAFPGLKVNCTHGDYIKAFRGIQQPDGFRKVVLFLGASIGNFTLPEAEDFINIVSTNVSRGDLLLIGFDLRKHPRIILNAYNDSEGVTKKFNLNILDRINKELGANFSLSNFDHHPTYDPFNGECKSYLVSNLKQNVHISALDASISFQEGEVIHTEVSRKYTTEEITTLANKCGFKVTHNFFDSKKYFVNTLWMLD